MKMEAEVIQKLISKDKELFGSPKKVFSYGTAGFRDKFGYSFVLYSLLGYFHCISCYFCRGDLLEQVVFRMGILAHLRSIATKSMLQCNSWC